MAVNPTVLTDMWAFDDFSRRVATKFFQGLESDNEDTKTRARYAILGLSNVLDALETGNAAQLAAAQNYLGAILPPAVDPAPEAA